MAQPTNYVLDVQQPFQAAAQGYQVGSAIRNDQIQQQAAQQQLAQQQALRQAYLQTANAPTADNFARLMLLDPKASEGIKRSWETLNTQQQQAKAADYLQWGAAIKSGKPQIAADMLTQRADAIDQQNNGQVTQESQLLRTWAKAAVDHPEYALGQIQALLTANPLGKDAAETLSKFGAEQRAAEQAPGALRKVNADADKAVADAKAAGVAAKYAEQNALKDLEKKGWDIKNIESEIGFRKESNRIRAMEAAIASQTNVLRRQELQLQVDKAKSELDQKVRDKAADYEASATSIDNSLNTIERLKRNPSLNDVLGSIEGRLPSVFSDQGADAIALIDTLGSQSFLSQAANLKGMGALSNAEGEKLQSALTNLSRTQSETQFRANLDEAARLLKKGRDTLSKRTGLPATPVDTPAAPGARPPLSSFFTQPGG